MTLARNTLAYWTSQVGNFALSFITSVFTSVFLGREYRGLLVAVILANTLALNLSNLGLQTLSMYFTGKEPGRVSRLHTLIVWLIAALALLDFAFIALGGEWMRIHVLEQVKDLQDFPAADLVIALGVLPFTLYFFAAQGVLSGLGRVRELSRFLLYYSICANGFNLAALGIWRGDRAGLVQCLIWIWALSQVVGAVVAFALIRKTPCRWERISPREIVAGWIPMLSYGLRAFVGNFASTMINRTDHLFVLASFGKVGIGAYNLSAKLAELVFQPAAAFENAAYSQIVAPGKAESARLVQDLFRTNFLLNLCAVGLFMILARPFVLIAYTSEFESAIRPLQILLPGTLFYAGSRILALYFSAQLGRPQIPSMIGWLAALVNVPALWWVVVNQGSGLAGAACVTTGCYGLMLVCFLLLFALHTGLRNPIPYFIPQARDALRARRLISGILRRESVH